ncbi:coiled-coil domain-containing protein 177 isoform X2 [Nematostella vectensis]|uniref:coiled-coil domain-containing protein 177 isoform X2 n=1 Tax=Nematostella vectensis TaxID=45351 RepID=UPI0020771A8D|nr:coiled-coil domain-containing protein 177 isoform X2 [Nematostella vectensis]
MSRNREYIWAETRDETDDWQRLFDKSESSRQNKAAAPDHLDLYNFDEPGTEESRYVLTSPRSLEACARFGIKPVELLHKSYEEFLDEFQALYDTNYSHEAVHEVFQEHERQRKRKLKLCREERERIIQEQGRRDSDAVIGEFTKTSPADKHRDSRSTESPVGREQKENRYTSSASMPVSHSTPDLHQERVTISYDEAPVSLKEKSVNGQGTRERSDFAGRPPSGKKIGKSNSFSHRDAKTKGEASDLNVGDSTCMSPQVRRVRSQWSVPSSPVICSPATSPRPSRRGSNVSCNSMSGAWGKKPTNRTMSTECVLTAVKGKRMSKKDQRIIDLMLSRHEEAEQLRKERLMLDLEWDEQKQLENDLRQAREKQRRAEIYEQYAAKDAKQMQARLRRKEKEERLKQEKQEAIRCKQALWEQEKQKQEQIKKNQMQLKRLSEAEKKRQQEQNRRRKEREEEMTRNMSYLNLLDKHERASRVRNRQLTQEQMKLKLRNEEEKMKVSEMKDKVVQKTQEEKLSIRQQITEKHLRALENYEQQLMQRDNELRSSKRKKLEKVSRQREELERMESELNDWQRNLKAYQEESLKRAEVVASMKIAKKQQKTRTQLTEKQLEHTENLQRVKEDEERRKRAVEQDIEIKNERSELVTIEKEQIRKLSRETAVTSQAVRDLVREQTLKGSFDNMAHKAQVEAHVGRGPQTGHKNQSQIRLG